MLPGCSPLKSSACRYRPSLPGYAAPSGAPGGRLFCAVILRAVEPARAEVVQAYSRLFTVTAVGNRRSAQGGDLFGLCLFRYQRPISAKLILV